MPIMFNSLLTQNALDPANVVLLRHQDQRAARGRTPYELWRDDRPASHRDRGLPMLFGVQSEQFPQCAIYHRSAAARSLIAVIEPALQHSTHEDGHGVGAGGIWAVRRNSGRTSLFMPAA